MTLTSLFLAATLACQVPPGEAGRKPESASDRLEFMKESVKSYVFRDKEGREATIVLRPEPAFRLGMQGDGVVLEGAIFLWADEVGRPEAAAQVFLAKSE